MDSPAPRAPRAPAPAPRRRSALRRAVALARLWRRAGFPGRGVLFEAYGDALVAAGLFNMNVPAGKNLYYWSVRFGRGRGN